MDAKENFPKWKWNEYQQVGTDYASEAEVAIYDRRMRQMRDIDGENRMILDLLKLPPDGSVMEIGTGTGALIRMAAKQCAHAVGIDISPVMLKYAQMQAESEGLSNIKFHQAGFLSYEYQPETFDGIVSGLAFHHLPDTWQAVALRKIHSALKPGGRFVLLDVVFDWKEETPETYFERIVSAEQENRPNLARHIAQEYSTLGWIMEGLLERAGFAIEFRRENKEFLCLYCAKKEG